MSSFSFSAKTFFRSSALILIAFCFSFAANHILADEDTPVLSMQKISDDNIRVFVDGKFFAEYRSDYKGTPIIWPICGPNQTLVTRAWPMIEDIDVDAEQDPLMKTIYENAVISERGGVKDHPHHRSLWFNHGDVLRGDFWGGTPSVIKQSKLLSATCDGHTATVSTENFWYNDKLGRDVCRDVRTAVFGSCFIGDKPVRYLDFSIEIFALEDGVIFGDTKEGSFGIRVPSPTAMTTKKLNPNWGGDILNDAGERGGETWSKRSKWVNYTGPAERFLTGEELAKEFMKANNASDFPLTSMGIAVFSGPNSLGAPAWRHVRDYGLFASNPFGQHDFEPHNPKADGSQKINKGESLFFAFRVLFHNGDLTAEELNQAYQAYAK
ncbi:MAG: PmoA family protein [Thermoguttaceae bacterium]|nr:PmoA family protein [Thermoguttaceae bacterium]